MSEPIALAPGEGEVLVDEPTRSSRIKAARDEVLLSEPGREFFEQHDIYDV